MDEKTKKALELAAFTGGGALAGLGVNWALGNTSTKSKIISALTGGALGGGAGYLNQTYREFKDTVDVPENYEEVTEDTVKKIHAHLSETPKQDIERKVREILPTADDKKVNQIVELYAGDKPVTWKDTATVFGVGALGAGVGHWRDSVNFKNGKVGFMDYLFDKDGIRAARNKVKEQARTVQDLQDRIYAMDQEINSAAVQQKVSDLTRDIDDAKAQKQAVLDQQEQDIAAKKATYQTDTDNIETRNTVHHDTIHTQKGIIAKEKQALANAQALRDRLNATEGQTITNLESEKARLTTEYNDPKTKGVRKQQIQARIRQIDTDLTTAKTNITNNNQTVIQAEEAYKRTVASADRAIADANAEITHNKNSEKADRIAAKRAYEQAVVQIEEAARKQIEPIEQNIKTLQEQLKNTTEPTQKGKIQKLLDIEQSRLNNLNAAKKQAIEIAGSSPSLKRTALGGGLSLFAGFLLNLARRGLFENTRANADNLGQIIRNSSK